MLQLKINCMFDVLGISLCMFDVAACNLHAKISPCIPGGTFHEMSQTLKEADINTCATSGQKLGHVLCENKTHSERKQRKWVD